MRKYLKSHGLEFWVNLDEIALGKRPLKQHFTLSLNERKIKYTVPLGSRFELMILSLFGPISVLISDCFTFQSIHTHFIQQKHLLTVIRRLQEAILQYVFLISFHADWFFHGNICVSLLLSSCASVLLSPESIFMLHQ